MSFINLLGVLGFAWLASCFYYLWRISRVARSNSKGALFGSFHKMNGTARNIVRKQFRSILIATLLFVIAVFFAYFVSQSSE